MDQRIQSGAEALVMDGKDHIATAIKDLQVGQIISCMKQGVLFELCVMEPIPFGHKIAIQSIEQGELIRKYGEVIGRATVAIPQGTHVHVHNLEGTRGRGDLPTADTSSVKGGQPV